jgi:glycosyltransferase involved in cell wall biosynthesis
MSQAVAVVTMSELESFSQLVMEGWACGRPVVVNARCDVTRGHCELSGGGLWVEDAEELAEALHWLHADARLRRRLALAGQEYVRTTYSWPAVMARLTDALIELTA